MTLPAGVRLRRLWSWLPMAGITIGSTIWLKVGQEDKIPHELVHVRQQREDGWRFFPRYVFSARWRVKYESEAYAESVRQGEDPGECAAMLASGLYLWPCRPLDALEAIHGWLK